MDDSPPTCKKREKREKREKRKLPIDEDDDLLELDLTLASSQSSQESPPKKLKISDDTQTPMDLDTKIFEELFKTRKPRSILQMPFNEREMGRILRQLLGYPDRDFALRLLAKNENSHYLLDMFAQENGWFGDPTSLHLIQSGVSFLGDVDKICDKSFCPMLKHLFVENELLKILFQLWIPAYVHAEDHTGMPIYIYRDGVILCKGNITNKASPPDTYGYFVDFDLDFGNFTTSVMLGLSGSHTIHIRNNNNISFPLSLSNIGFFITN
uniref:Uncharacterized protein n=1 Tax=viral metagenome TaxID=1070528 RepID=A0A6C0E0A5_9ZZZZ